MACLLHILNEVGPVGHHMFEMIWLMRCAKTNGKAVFMHFDSCLDICTVLRGFQGSCRAFHGTVQKVYFLHCSKRGTRNRRFLFKCSRWSILRSITEVLETKKGRGRSFGNQLKRLLQEAMELWRTYHVREVRDLPAAAKPLQEAITHHLRDRVLPDRDNQRLLDELGWHHDRGNLLRFLDDPSIEPTNNRGERALRPAVIARKVSQCSKNDAGAYTFSAFKSVVQTLAKRGIHSMVEGLNQVFRSGSIQGIPP